MEQEKKKSDAPGRQKGLQIAFSTVYYVPQDPL